MTRWIKPTITKEFAYPFSDGIRTINPDRSDDGIGASWGEWMDNGWVWNGKTNRIWGLYDGDKYKDVLFLVINPETGVAESIIARPNTGAAATNSNPWPLTSYNVYHTKMVYDDIGDRIWLFSGAQVPGRDYYSRYLWEFVASTGAFVKWTYLNSTNAVHDCNPKYNPLTGELWTILDYAGSVASLSQKTNNFARINKTTHALESVMSLKFGRPTSEDRVSPQTVVFTPSGDMYTIPEQQASLWYSFLDTDIARKLYKVVAGATVPVADLGSNLAWTGRIFYDMFYEQSRNALILFASSRAFFGWPEVRDWVYKYDLTTGVLTEVGHLPISYYRSPYGEEGWDKANLPAFEYDQYRDVIWYLRHDSDYGSQQYMTAVEPNTAAVVYSVPTMSIRKPFCVLNDDKGIWFDPGGSDTGVPLVIRPDCLYYQSWAYLGQYNIEGGEVWPHYDSTTMLLKISESTPLTGDHDVMQNIKVRHWIHPKSNTGVFAPYTYNTRCMDHGMLYVPPWERFITNVRSVTDKSVLFQLVDTDSGYVEEPNNTDTFTYINRPNYGLPINTVTTPQPYTDFNINQGNLIYDPFTNRIWMTAFVYTSGSGHNFQVRHLFAFDVESQGACVLATMPQGNQGHTIIKLNPYNGELWAILSVVGSHTITQDQVVNNYGRINKTTGLVELSYALKFKDKDPALVDRVAPKTVVFTPDGDTYVIPDIISGSTTDLNDITRSLYKIVAGATVPVASMDGTLAGEFFYEMFYEASRHSIFLFSVKNALPSAQTREWMHRYDLTTGVMTRVCGLPKGNTTIYNQQYGAQFAPIYVYDKYRDLIWYGVRIDQVTGEDEYITAIRPDTGAVVADILMQPDLPPVTNTTYSWSFSSPMLKVLPDGVYAQGEVYSDDVTYDNRLAMVKITGDLPPEHVVWDNITKIEYTYPTSMGTVMGNAKPEAWGDAGMVYVKSTNRIWQIAFTADGGDLFQVVNPVNGFVERYIPLPNNGSSDKINFPSPNVYFNTWATYLVYNEVDDTVWLSTAVWGYSGVYPKHVFKFNGTTGALIGWGMPFGTDSNVAINLHYNKYDGEVFALPVHAGTTAAQVISSISRIPNDNLNTNQNNFQLVFKGLDPLTTARVEPSTIVFTPAAAFVLAEPQVATGIVTAGDISRSLYKIVTTTQPIVMADLETIGTANEFFYDMLYEDSRDALYVFSVDMVLRKEWVYRYTLLDGTLTRLAQLPLAAHEPIYYTYMGKQTRPIFTYDSYRDLIWYMPKYDANTNAGMRIMALNATDGSQKFSLGVNSLVEPVRTYVPIYNLGAPFIVQRDALYVQSYMGNTVADPEQVGTFAILKIIPGVEAPPAPTATLTWDEDGDTYVITGDNIAPVQTGKSHAALTQIFQRQHSIITARQRQQLANPIALTAPHRTAQNDATDSTTGTPQAPQAPKSGKIRRMPPQPKKQTTPEPSPVELLKDLHKSITLNTLNKLSDRFEQRLNGQGQSEESVAAYIKSLLKGPK